MNNILNNDNDNLIPFGGRVFIEVDENDISSIGNNIKKGKIVKISKLFNLINDTFNSSCSDFTCKEISLEKAEFQTILYFQASLELEIGKTVRYNHEQKLIEEVSTNIYSVSLNSNNNTRQFKNTA